ncbi:MAG: S41 family peptidase, partial [Bacteroidaceae bacterium]|nr:S41 family peptidase [Bacteroidaceae bacterium]
MSNNKHRLTPLAMSLCVVFGILVGTFYTGHFSGNRLNLVNSSSNKLNQLLQIVNNFYVEDVDVSEMVESAMPSLLKELDPHSVYISAKEAKIASDDLKGNFSGIGISFNVQHDSVVVLRVIKGGPSEKVGLQYGDRIVKADGKSLVGVEQDEIMRTLRGESDSNVELKVVRHGMKDTLTFNVIRGVIPVRSIETAYMLTPETGYIGIKKFSETTYKEFFVALAELNMRGMKNLIVDLRGNTGGYLHIVTQMANEFLNKDELIVYTQGRKSPREDYRSDGHGSFRNIPLVVLIDEISASASEIFAGAIQDNDRGTIIGRRSFGKGLVQQPMEFQDGSMIRLTVARYYTPSGRCIQRPYVKGHGEDYENDLIARYERGEFFNEDSIKQDGKPFKTSIGRVVYDGGGISPDIFIPQDTSAYTSYYQEAVYQGHLRQFTQDYCDENRVALSKYDNYISMQKYLAKQDLQETFANYAQKRGLKRRNLMLKRSKPLFQRAIWGGIIYN